MAVEGSSQRRHCKLSVAHVRVGSLVDATARQGKRRGPDNRPLMVFRLEPDPIDDEPVACRGRHRKGYPAAAMSCLRKGFKTRSASRAAVKSRTAAMRKTSFKLPAPAGSKFAIGTTRAAVHLAV